jgi:hypothetical protein
MLEERFSSQLKARDENGNYVVDDARLVNYLQNPGTVPSFMVLSEIERRQAENMRREKAQAQPQAPTVKDQAIASLGQQMPQGMPIPEQTEMNPAERAGSGIAALNPPVQMAEGGVVGYQLGGNVNIPSNTVYPNYLDQPRAFQGFDANIQATQQNIFKLKEQLAKLKSEPNERPLLISQVEEQLRAQQEYLNRPKTGGGFTPTESPMMSDEEAKLAALKSGNTLQKDLPIGETTTNKTKLQDQESVFEGARLDTGKRDTSKFDELMMEDPDVYRARMEKERQEALGESPFGKALDTETERAKKAQSRKKDFVVGEFLMNLGNSVMQQKPGEALDLTKATDRLSQGNQEYLDMIRNDDKYKLELQRLDRADKEATLKFGVDSEERARINNQKVGLESIKTQVEYDKMANDLEKAGINATAYGKYLTATLGRDKLGYQVVSDINAEMQKDPRYMPIYQDLMVIDRKKNPTKEDLEERKKLETKIEVEKARRFKEYSKFAGLDQDALSQVDKGLIKPPEGFNVVPLDK